MPTETQEIETLANREYKWGFVTDIEADSAPPGLNEDIIRFISHKKGEPDWLLQWRLKAYRHWLTMEQPNWPFLPYGYGPIDYQNTIYYSAPKPKNVASITSGGSRPRMASTTTPTSAARYGRSRCTSGVIRPTIRSPIQIAATR